MFPRAYIAFAWFYEDIWIRPKIRWLVIGFLGQDYFQRTTLNVYVIHSTRFAFRSISFTFVRARGETSWPERFDTQDSSG